MAKLDINVHDITRVEGHGNIVVNVTNGELQQCELQITESPRLYEAMLVGRPWNEAAHITCRICGICSVGHTTASVRAMENALGVHPSEQTRLLRKLIMHGEFLQSHVLHVAFLALPDFLGVGSVIPLASSHPEAVKIALRLKRLANDICCAIGGRHIHPIAEVVGGWTKLPEPEALLGLKERIVAAVPDVEAVVDLLSTVQVPAFERETEYLAVHHPSEYGITEGVIRSSLGDDTDEMNYLDKIKEFVVPHSHAKFVGTDKSPSHMAGALARFNINHAQLRSEATAVAEALGLRAPCHNPYMITVAQMVETVHCAYDALDLIDTLVARGIQPEKPDVAVRAGRGAAAVEVPRGILFHDYTVGADGLTTAANLIIPTTQNLYNIENDMRALVPQILDKSQDEIALALEMLVRAYDPCISCATHLLDVRFVQ